MGFLNNIGKAISDAGNSTIQKGKDAVNAAKYNRMIADEEKDLAKYFEELGKKYYESHKDDFEPGFAQIFDDINSAYSRINEYQQMIDDLQGIVKCSQCGANIPEGASFCPECGSKVILPVQEEKTPEPGKLYCTECGAEIAPGSKFCMVCGMKVELLEDIIPSGEEIKEELNNMKAEVSRQAEEAVTEAVTEAVSAAEDAVEAVKESIAD